MYQARIIIVFLFCLCSWGTVAFHQPSLAQRKESYRLTYHHGYPSPSINRFAVESTKSTALSALRRLSLDSTIIPGSKMGGAEQLIMLVALSVLMVRNVFPILIGSVRTFAFAEGSADQSRNSVTNSLPSAFFNEIITSFRTMLINMSRFSENLLFNIQSKSSVWTSGISDRLSSLFRRQPEIVQLDDWKVCSLQSKEMLSGGRYCRYRFDLENSGAKIPRYIGQEVRDYDVIVDPSSIWTLTGQGFVCISFHLGFSRLKPIFSFSFFSTTLETSAGSVFHRFKRSRTQRIVFSYLSALSKRIFRDIS